MRSGVRTFGLLLFGLCVSQLGSQMTGFALGVRVFRQTGSVSLFSVMVLMMVGPPILVSPLAGILADRWDRRRVLVLAEGGAAASALLLLALFALSPAGAIPTWAVLAIVGLTASFSALEFPALAASMTVLVPREQHARVNGLAQLGGGVARVLAPALAGVLLDAVDLGGIVIVDVASSLVAIATLLAARVPRPEAPRAGRAARESKVREATYGLRYAARRPALLVLLACSALVSFNLGSIQVVFTPLVLSFADARVLGIVNSIGGVGMLVASGAMVAWGGPKRRLDAVLGLVGLQGALLLLAAARPSILLAGAGAFGFLAAFPIMMACSQTIWQRKVPVDVQGRVFGTRAMVAHAALLASCLVVGPLVDRVLEPAMAAGGALAPTFGRLLGVGPGRGAALFVVLLGGVTIVGAILGFFHPRVRGFDDEGVEEHVAAAPVGAAKEQLPCAES